MNIRIARYRRQVGALASVLALVALAGCTSLPASDTEKQAVCARDVSIAEVSVMILAAPIDSTIHMEIDWAYVDGSDAGVSRRPNVIGPLEVGQTYVLPPGYNSWGFVDLGRCLDVVGSPGVRFQVTSFPVVDPGIILLYAASGGHVPSQANINTGHLP